jgi:hypothetical protein
MLPTNSTRAHATRAVTPKAIFCVRVRFRSAASDQMIELMIAAAKGARTNTFICGRSSNDPGAPNSEVASLLQIDGKHAGNRTSDQINLPRAMAFA